MVKRTMKRTMKLKRGGTKTPSRTRTPSAKGSDYEKDKKVSVAKRANRSMSKLASKSVNDDLTAMFGKMVVGENKPK